MSICSKKKKSWNKLFKEKVRFLIKIQDDFPSVVYTYTVLIRCSRNEKFNLLGEFGISSLFISHTFEYTGYW